MRCLGLDVGDKWIGVALSDPLGILASPLTVIKRQDVASDIEAITEIIDRDGVGQIIVGLPISMDGSTGKQAEKVDAFAEELRHRTKAPLEYRDERWSTISARRLMRDVSAPKNKGKIKDDAIAAAIILQGYLDEKHLNSW